MPTPRRFRAIVVADPIDRYMHAGPSTMPDHDRRRYDLTRDEMRTMIPRLLNRPVKVDHLGEAIGKVVSSSESRGRWYAECEMFDSPAAHIARDKIRRRKYTNVSLQHNPETLEVHELSLCEQGRRENSVITDILVSASMSADNLKEKNYIQDIVDDDYVHFIETASSTVMASVQPASIGSDHASTAQQIYELQQRLEQLTRQQQQQQQFSSSSSSPPIPVSAAAQPPVAGGADSPPAPPGVEASDEEFNQWVDVIKASTVVVANSRSMDAAKKKQYIEGMASRVDTERKHREVNVKQMKETEFRDLKMAHQALLDEKHVAELGQALNFHNVPLEHRGKVGDEFKKGNYLGALSMMKQQQQQQQQPSSSSSSQPGSTVAASYQSDQAMQSESLINQSMDQFNRIADLAMVPSSARGSYQPPQPRYNQPYHQQQQYQAPQQYQAYQHQSSYSQPGQSVWTNGMSGTVKASVAPGPDYAQHSGDNKSAVRFPFGRTWTDIATNSHAATLLNGADGNVDFMDVRALNKPNLSSRLSMGHQ